MGDACKVVQGRRPRLQLAKPCAARKECAPAQPHGVSAMKLFDWLTGTKRPAAGVSAKTSAEVRADLLAVNRPSAPFVVRDGAPENVDLVAEWRIVDARWYEIFAKAGLTKVFKIRSMSRQAKSVRSIRSGRSNGAPGFRSCRWLRKHSADRPGRSARPSPSRSRAVLAKFTATSSRPRKSKRLCKMP